MIITYEIVKCCFPTFVNGCTHTQHKKYNTYIMYVSIIHGLNKTETGAVKGQFFNRPKSILM